MARIRSYKELEELLGDEGFLGHSKAPGFETVRIPLSVLKDYISQFAGGVTPEQQAAIIANTTKADTNEANISTLTGIVNLNTAELATQLAAINQNDTDIDGLQAQITALQSQIDNSKTGYSHTGAFRGKPSGASYVWQAGTGIKYTEQDVVDERWRPFSLDLAAHQAVDNPYWTDPQPGTTPNVGLFRGEYLPAGVSSLVDYEYNYDDANYFVNNYVKYSNNLTSGDWSNGTLNPVSIITEVDLSNPPPNEPSHTKVTVNSTGLSSVFYKLKVLPFKTYTFSFKARLETGSTLVPQYSIRDFSNNTAILSNTSYANLINENDWSTVEYTFTTPLNCNEVELFVLRTTGTTGAVQIAEVQLCDGSVAAPYQSTTGQISRSEVISHLSYAYPDNITGHEGTVGRIKLNDILPGDQLRVRFDFNAIPQIANTTLEPALWYSNRNANDEITFSFPLTHTPIFFGTGTVGKVLLQRPEISAWIASTEDVNALALPAVKSDNPIIIQPLGMLITILR